MENYQILGLIGSLLLIVGIGFSFAFYYPSYGMMGVYGYGMMGRGMMFFGFMGLLIIPAFVLGIIGSLISDRTVAGVLLILASVLSIPAMGLIGIISFILLLIAGILALTSGKKT
ncbi:hypothetical protein GFS03_05560 [Sulfolobus sp. E5-1-F]|uniref:hypothetical protein n=1 Tax=Sulfolobaceae TaxID=118883 RepID=UPI001294BE3B|nr:MULTISPECIES: hypothetical protein [unclassified Sulfolobus]QGA54072.1 hypothetical protein GFS03_05560 [Sulfolobus sp. E5-1-F]QGA69134.1 hypothetical protein GFS33_10860 [Sulfolobus sp. E11-6]